MLTENETAEPVFNLYTPDGGRGYIAHLFKNVLKRHDYRQYINERLAGDFACTLAQHFERITAERDALQQRVNAADQRIDDLAAAAEPFAKVADLYAGEEDNSYEPARDVGMHDDLRLTLAHFRALNDLCTKPLIKS
ncbi:hypothetical protein [Pseudomonas atacamensis]|uniref:hypothetical protein n=1 Tax=Pseudomonas atacamensis TaxID=2565368 RepID=UPI00300EE5FB